MEAENLLKNLRAGDKHAILVSRDPSYCFVVADNVTVSQSMNGMIDMAAVALRTRLTSQVFDVLATDDAAATMSGGQMTIEPEVVEAGTMRVTPDTALNLGILLLKHLVQQGLDRDVVLQRLSDENLA